MSNYPSSNLDTDSLCLHESLLVNEPISFLRGNSLINLNTHLLNSSYSIWKTEPTKNFNSISFFWNYKSNGKDYKKTISELENYFLKF